MTRKLYSSSEDRAILGICGGIGEYLDIDPIIVRLIVVILTLLGFSGLLFYIVAIFVIPESPEYRAV
ncbi:MAG: PspC domain-containing protein, partial [Firmicutes bacterium]|nr:PspC domain-containing protein [Bacillota bacterium]